MKIDVLLRKDLRLLDVFSVRVAERNHLDFLKLRGRLNSLRRLLGTDSSLDGWTTKELNARSDNQSALQQVEGLATAAESCRGVIAQLVAENWSFRDAAAVVPGRRKK